MPSNKQESDYFLENCLIHFLLHWAISYLFRLRNRPLIQIQNHIFALILD